MKKAFVLLALVLCSRMSSQTMELPPLDKITHFGAGYAISHTVYHVVQDKKKAFTIALLSGVAAGFAKEGLDVAQGRPWSWGDVNYTAFGALAGTVSFRIVLNYKQRNKGDFSAFENIGPIKEGLFDKPQDTNP